MTDMTVKTQIIRQHGTCHPPVVCRKAPEEAAGLELAGGEVTVLVQRNQEAWSYIDLSHPYLHITTLNK